MKNLLIALLLIPIFCFSQNDELQDSVTNSSKMEDVSVFRSINLDSLFYFQYDNKINLESNDLLISQYNNTITFHQRTEKEFMEVRVLKDSLFIVTQWEEHDAPFMKGMTCAVMNCQDDHKSLHRERLVYAVQGGEIVFVRKEQAKLIQKKVEKIATEIIEEWEW